MIITGFGPFGTIEKNPSWALAQEVAKRCGVDAVELPTSYSRGVIALQSAMYADPLIIMFGYASSVDGLRVESQAHNMVKSVQADVDGCVMTDHRQDGGGPEIRPVGFPVDQLSAAIEAAGCDVQISDSAGGYVCNWVFYAALGRADTIASFIHVGNRVDEEVIRGAVAATCWLNDYREGHR